MTQQSSTLDNAISTLPRYRVCIVPEAPRPTPPVKISDSAQAARALQPFFAGLDREQFIVCCLDAKHAVIGVNVVSIGSLTLSIVHPREVFKPAILLNSSVIIAAHNHPSGDSTPSTEDRVLTHRLKAAGELLGIALLDHVILGDGRHYSFADEGWPGS